MLVKASCALSRAIAILLIPFAGHSASAQTIEFMSEPPTADGKLNDAERALQIRQFPKQYRFDNPLVEEPEITYRLGFTPTHLFVAITTNADEVIYRNRGYLWGDGWRLLLGDTTEGSRTTSYIEVLVSPKAPGDDRIEMAIGTQDHVQLFRRLSDRSRSAEGVTDEGAVFEATIAWADLAPFDPVFDPRIGVNLYFAKGLSTP